MSFSLTSSKLEKLYGKISERVIQDSALEDISISTGAVPHIAMALYRPLSPYEQIRITDRISGTFTTPSKYEKHVELGKIRVGNEIRGVEVVRRFDDCNRCMKTAGCDRLEAGSIMFSKIMYTGYTNRDIAYKQSPGLFSANCDFRFRSHLPSKPPSEVMSSFFVTDIIPNSPRGWSGMMAFADDLLHGRRPRPLFNSLEAFLSETEKLERLNSATCCADLILDAYTQTCANVFTVPLKRFRHFQKALWKRASYSLQRIEEYCPECFEQDVRITSFNKKLEYYVCNKCRHSWTRNRRIQN